MLTHLQIRDFAIVEALELEFQPGMSAITGETGAGKSIMLDALGLLLGDRADSDAVAVGAERAEISATFEVGDRAEITAWLRDHELAGSGEQASECHLRRLINSQGRSRAYINGVSQPLAALKALGELLVDIHGQHENQALLKRDLQRELLDDYAGLQPLLKRHRQQKVLDDFAGHHAVLLELRGCFEVRQELRQRIERLRAADGEHTAKQELLQFQVHELDALALAAGETAVLEAEHKRLAAGEQLLDVSQQALNQLYDNDDMSAHRLLSRWLTELTQLSTADARLIPLTELINSALIQVDEAGVGLRDYVQGLEIDPQRLSAVESRLTEIYALARKHRVEPHALPDRLSALSGELDQLQNSDHHIEALEAELVKVVARYDKLAVQLTRQRKAAATDLGKRVTGVIRELGMPDGAFAAELREQREPTAHGLESVEFQVSANPGQPLRSLAKVASGGELSRISLAIHVIAADTARVPTLIFDEVDTGIGGAVAEVVGKRLRELGSRCQVLCVTHLPQVAAQAHRQFQVSKRVVGKKTQTDVHELSIKQRTEEIARMLGGVRLTKNTLAHAKEMIDRATN